MTNSITDQPTKHSSDVISAVIDFQTEGLFSIGVPHAHEEDETWVDCGFESTEEKTVRGYVGEAGAGGGGDEDYAPGYGGEGEEFSNGEAYGN